MLRQGHRSGVLYIDIDRFKAINDTHGHTVGDSILVEVARRITATCRSGDEVVRLGGDEFVVVLHDIDPATVTPIGSRMVDAVAEPLPDGVGVDQVTASVGAAMGTGDVRDLVSAADLAMLTGQRRGRNVLTTAGVPVGSP